ncbi:MAG: hypothetical protein FJX77_00705 [Armatimonadetes bacterium]|nr:hypothetical protein [Armatimonadota bacterium]
MKRSPSFAQFLAAACAAWPLAAAAQEPAAEVPAPPTAPQATAPGVDPALPADLPAPDPSLPRLTARRERLLAALVAQDAPPAATAAALQQQEVTVGDIRFRGDVIETSNETGLTTITGNPEITRGPDRLRATRIVLNPSNRQITAEGNVILNQGDQEFLADRATYSLESREGELERVRTRISDYFLNAEKIRLLAGPRYVAERIRFTACDDEHPHYQTFARRMEIRPRERMLARGLGLDLLGTRLATLTGFERSLRPGQESGGQGKNQYPSFGFDNRNGFYVERQFDVREKGPVWLDAYARINSSREPFLGLQAATAGDLQFVGSLFYRDFAENQRSRNLQVSRLPELGIVWTPGRDAPRPGRFLPHQVTGMRRPPYLHYSRDWQFAAQVTVGYFRQHRGDDRIRDDSTSRSGGRIQFQAQALLPYVKLARNITLNDLRLFGRQSVYDNNSAHAVLGVGIGKTFKLGNWRFGVDRYDQYTSGRTPFLFDDVELRNEWRPRFEFKTRNFNFSYFARLRAGGGGVFDQVFEISRNFHCLEPRLVYGVRQGFIGIDLRIAGLNTGPRPSTGGPRSIREASGPEEDGLLAPPTQPMSP